MHCCGRNRNERTTRPGKGKRTLLFGMLIGLVLGLLFAPKPGTETLDDLKEKILRKLPV